MVYQSESNLKNRHRVKYLQQREFNARHWLYRWQRSWEADGIVRTMWETTLIPSAGPTNVGENVLGPQKATLSNESWNRRGHVWEKLKSQPQQAKPRVKKGGEKSLASLSCLQVSSTVGGDTISQIWLESSWHGSPQGWAPLQCTAGKHEEWIWGQTGIN